MLTAVISRSSSALLLCRVFRNSRLVVNFYEEPSLIHFENLKEESQTKPKYGSCSNMNSAIELCIV